MKKLTGILLILALVCACLPAALAASIQPTAQALKVDGEAVRGCEIYNIDGSNYFKLRDLAALFNGTASQFDVDYDAAAQAIRLTTGAAYTHATGAELAAGADRSGSAVVSAQKLMVDGLETTGLSVWNIGGSNFFQLRELAQILGFRVDYDAADNTAIADSADYVPSAPAADAPVQCRQQEVDTSGGTVNAWVLRIDPRDPRVTVRSAMVDNRLGATAAFEDIVAAAGDPWAVVNGNFFEAYQAFQTPIGHVMTDGRFRYGHTGFTSLGIDARGGLHMGRLPLFTRVKASDGKEWTLYEINTAGGQDEGNSVLYTPSYGTELCLTLGAYVMTAAGGAVAGYRWAEAGETIPIPADGFLLYLTKSYAEQPWIQAPTPGTALSQPEPYLFNPTADSFDPAGMVSILSGSPRLVRGGAICTDMDEGFDDPTRFGPTAAAGRTAAGIDTEGRLVLASVNAATIQQMRELMLSLGCVEAINLDGGASRALYCEGSFLCRAGRPLTTTLQIFYRE